MKEHPTILAAREAVDAKLAELAAAELVVKGLRGEVNDARLGVIAAQDAEDVKYPTARLVSVGWRTGKETDMGRVAIVKRTPTGILVTRRRGIERRFKPSKITGVFYEVGADRFGYVYDTVQLRDVPLADQQITRKAGTTGDQDAR